MLRRTVLKVVSVFVLTLAVAGLTLGDEIKNPFLGDRPVGEYLQAISVNVKAGSAQGSGTIFIVNVEGQKTAFVLTAAHVVDSLRRTRTYHEDGTEKTAIYYDDAQISQEHVYEGRVVGRVVFDAKVLNVDGTRDIALLRVRKNDAFSVGGFFYPNDLVPVGTRVLHCGAPGGIEIGGTASLTNGIISRVGVKITDFTPAEFAVFDQTTCPALGGSSGGLVALEENGAWVGMITIGLRLASNFNWMVPVRMVRKWAKDVKVEWLLDPNAKVTEEQIEKIPIEVGRIKGGMMQTETGSTPERNQLPIFPRIDITSQSHLIF